MEEYNYNVRLAFKILYDSSRDSLNIVRILMMLI